MRRSWKTLLVWLLVATLAHVSTVDADDAVLDRAKEMLHRTQEALRQAQAENSQLKAANAAAEEKLQAVSKQVDVATQGTKTAQQTLRVKLQSAQSLQSDAAGKLANANARLTEMNDKQRATLQVVANLNAELAHSQTLLQESRAANISCEDKNDKLYTYGTEILDRYEKKGVLASLAQKEPVFGLKEVAMENVVQEYKAKFAAQKITPLVH